MDPSLNAWAASTSVPATHSPTQSASRKDRKDQEAMIEKLAKEIEDLKASMKPKNPAPAGKGKNSTVKSAPRHTQNANSSSSSAPKKKAPLQTTPLRNQRATSAPPEVMIKQATPKPRKAATVAAVAKPSPKQHPQQLQTGDFPPAFGPTKTALYVHIKILWGLLKQDAVPKPPDLSRLEEFYRRFRRTEQLEEAVRSGSSNRNHQVLSFRDVKGGRIKYSRSVIHLGSNFIRYTKGLLASLGLTIWCPNLDKDSNSLYNSAHRIAALTTFTELATTPAYAYLKVDPQMAQDMSLLIPAYNHFVHYLQVERYKKEIKEEGKAAQEVVKKRFSKNRERLRDERRDFAIVNKFPQRYRAVLEQIAAHSDNEEVPGKGFYKIKTLPYRSKNANCFFCRLDVVMMKAAEQDPLSKSSRRRVRRLPKDPVISMFKTAPKGLPIDFYDPNWYHNLVPAQQHSIPNRTALAFLPNANESLLPKAERHPDEKLADSTFTRKYWEIVVEPYGLLDDSSDEEAGVNNEPNNNDEEGEGIDLTQPSPDVLDSEDEYHVEGDAGDLYDDKEDDQHSSEHGKEGQGSNESDDNEYEDDEDDDDYNEANDGMAGDGDHQMIDIPEGEEEW